ncbi:MAG: hypothetical protein QW474_00505 [Candidatus Aenigmatarchaeota archaeon]
MKKLFLIIVMILTNLGYSQQFTIEELRKIDLKLRNYTILSQQNILLQEKVILLEYKLNEYEKKNNWVERNKLYIGFLGGIIFSYSMFYLTIKFLRD